MPLKISAAFFIGIATILSDFYRYFKRKFYPIEASKYLI